MPSIALGVLSLLGSLLQVVYMAVILYLLRQRQRRLRVSAERRPAGLQAAEATRSRAPTDATHGGTVSHTHYYKNFLPASFHSVAPAEREKLLQHGSSGSEAADALVVAAAEAGFSYQTAETPVGSVGGGFSLNGGGSSLLTTPLPPDLGRISFSSSYTPANPGFANLYDEEDPFSTPSEDASAPEHEQDPHAVASSRAFSARYAARCKQSSIIEEEDENMVMPASSLPQTSSTVFSPASLPTDDFHVSLDGDDLALQPRNIELIVDGMNVVERGTESSGGIALDVCPTSRSQPTTHGALFTSGAMFSMPQHKSGADSYSLISDDPAPFDHDTSLSVRGSAKAPKRHILHPKSYARGDADGTFLAPADGVLRTASAATRRRASQARRIAALKASAAAAVFNGTAPPSPLRTANGILIPQRDPSEPKWDPNMSPVRSRVKFADSPRDRSAAAALLAMRSSPQLPEFNLGEQASPTKSTDQPEQHTQVISPRPRRQSVLKHRPPPPPVASTSSTPAPILVLPIYYRFLILQLFHCLLWGVASLILLGFGTNLVEWSTHGFSHTAGGSWMFGCVMGFLFSVHACVGDGLLVFLAAKNVGRATTRFSLIFAFVWGAINGIAVLVVVQSVAPPVDPEPGQLPMWHPFFVRSCAAMALSLFVLLAPNACVCGTRARRSNMCRKSREERALALQRQQLKWEASQGAIDLDDAFDEDAYESDTPLRNTWLKLALFNVVYHVLVLIVYALNFTSAGNSDLTWENILVVLLGFGFIVTTPLFYWCLQNDSAYWANEWKSALLRMKEEAEVEEKLQASQHAAAVAKAQAAGQPIPPPPAQKPSTYASFNGTSSQDFFLDYSVLEYGSLLGSGGFSSVYAAKLWGSLDVAVKVLHVRDTSKEIVDQFLHEVGIVLQLNHPNVVQFLGVVFSPPDMVLVMERCRRQSLLQLIKQKKVRFSEFQAVSIGLAIADALRYIHEQDILHRDLKAANILFDLSGRPRVCDFGLSEERTKIDLNHVFCGTLAYMSPEVLRSETVGKPSDVYSFSIILWELLHNELAWKRGGGPNQKGLNARILVEMVAYRRARPPVKERVVVDPVQQPSGDASQLPPLATDSVRIHPQAFAPDAPAPAADADAPLNAPRPAIHPMLVKLLRECWRDDYRRRPTFADIVRRLTAFREMIRAQQHTA